MNNALEEHIIAYIDLLGVKEKIKNGDLKSKDMIHHYIHGLLMLHHELQFLKMQI